MNIKLDENLSRHLKERLLPLGHNASTAFEEGLLGKVDVEVGAAAKGEDRIVFTLDLDFADLRKSRQGHTPESSCLDRAAWGLRLSTNSC